MKDQKENQEKTITFSIKPKGRVYPKEITFNILTNEKGERVAATITSRTVLHR